MRGSKPIRVGELWKSCTECEAVLPLDEFHKNAHSPDLRHSKCKKCKNDQARKTYSEKEIKDSRPSYASSRERHLLRTYGINLKKYNELLVKQKYCCGVCEKHQDDEKKSLHVDHNHETGEIRGLLCNFCNRQVIGKHKDPELFLKAAKYLSKGTGLIVPKRIRPKKRKPKRN